MKWTCDQIEARLSDYLDGLMQGPERGRVRRNTWQSASSARDCWQVCAAW